MAEHGRKLKSIGRSASTESTDYSVSMGRSIREKKKKPKERWLLTRKTWRYMADAGRKLIPDGSQNRTEDIPKIEAYFQEVCKREPKFLLWRKNSYPGAMGFRKKRKEIKKGGSCRKATSADCVNVFKFERPTNLPLHKSPSTQKLKYDFLKQPDEDQELISMLEHYLKITPSTSSVNHQELIDRLQRHLLSQPSQYSTPHLEFQGDYVQRSLADTLSRYFSQSGSRDKIISDLLTDRKALENLYFHLRKTRGFRSPRLGGDYSPTQFKLSLLRFADRTLTPPSTREHPPPLIEIEHESLEIRVTNSGTQTLPVSESILHDLEEKYKKAQSERDEEDRKEYRPTGRRRSSVDNDDVSQSVSDTIKRYLRMARKKSVDSDKVDRFKRVNYDRNLRNIKAKGEITKPGDDDGLNKGCQTNEDWVLNYRDLKFADFLSDVESRISSSRSSIDVGVEEKSSPSSPPPVKSQSFLSHLLHKHSTSTVTTGPMQKSKSSSSVMHHGGRLMAKKIFRSRSKSQTRPGQGNCNWTPQGSCVWSNITGKQVVLGSTSLQYLSDAERKVLQKVVLAKLQALNLGVNVKIPTENVTTPVAKQKRRPYLLKRKALTTSIFDTNRKENEKDGATGGVVFGIPLTQCIENDRISRTTIRTSPFRSRPEISSEEHGLDRHGSRSSFSSLIEAPRGDERGSCESLLLRERIVGSVPGLLDKLSCGSTPDLQTALDEEPAIPNILQACFKHIEQCGLRTLGIFRVSTSKKRIRQLREDFDCGKETTLDEEQCPHDVATLLKEYLRDLPDPLLCRELYQAFIQTQRIRNRSLQFEAIQHLIQLLPTPNRNTLHALLCFLSQVAQNATDFTSDSGECISGNKMDSNNLATVFAPNILHCIRPGSSKETASDRPEDRIDIINVVRILIDHYKQIFTVSADLLDEIYLHMMDTNPEVLDQLLAKREPADESVDELDSESYSAPWSPTSADGDQMDEPKRTYSREACLHEAAATGGPNISMRIRHKDRIKERSSRKKREESASRKKREEESGVLSSSITSAKNIISRFRVGKDEDYIYNKNRSSSLESTSSTHTDSDLHRVLRISEEDGRKSSPYILDDSGVITASLTIPVQTALNLDDDIPYIEDGDNGRQQLMIGLVRTPSIPVRRRQRSMSGSDSSVASVQPVPGLISLVQSYDSAVGSSATSASQFQNTPPQSISSGPDQGICSSPPSWASSPPTSPDNTQTLVNYIPDDTTPRGIRTQKSASLQKVSFSTTQELQKTRNYITSSFEQSKVEPKFSPSITSIGNAVLRSKTADFERITKVEVQKSKTVSEKKKYTKRRYTDSRHQTRHIPDAETLETEAAQSKGEDVTAAGQAGPVYKRRELISSVPSK